MENGLELDVVVGNIFLSMYVKCGSLDEVCNVFDILFRKDVVIWISMLVVYVEYEDGREVFYLYGRMEYEGMILVDLVMFVCFLKVCIVVGVLV